MGRRFLPIVVVVPLVITSCQSATTETETTTTSTTEVTTTSSTTSTSTTTLPPTTTTTTLPEIPSLEVLLSRVNERMAGVESVRVLQTYRIFTIGGDPLFSSTAEGQGTFDGGEGPETGWWSFTVFRVSGGIVAFNVDRESQGVAYDRDIESLEWTAKESHSHTLDPLRASVEGRLELAAAEISWETVDEVPTLRVETDYDDGTEVKPHILWFGSDGSLLRYVVEAETIDPSDAEDTGFPEDALVEEDNVILSIGDPMLDIVTPPLMATSIVPGRIVPFLVELPREGWSLIAPEELDLFGYSLAVGNEQASIGIIDIDEPGLTLEAIHDAREIQWAALIGPGGGIFVGTDPTPIVTLQGEPGLTMTATAILGDGRAVEIRELYVIGEDSAFAVSATFVDAEDTVTQLLIDYVFQSVYMTDQGVADAIRPGWYQDNS